MMHSNVDQALTPRARFGVLAGLLVAGFTFAFMPCSASADLRGGTWDYRMKITFPGYTNAETLADFPALVTFSEDLPTFSYSQFSAPVTGGDLRFRDANDIRELDFEIEQWWPVVTPTNIAGCVLWLRADDGVLTDGSTVTNWLDCSGNNNHASTTDPNLQPTLVNGVVNGLPVVRFPNQYRYLTFSPTIAAQGSTVFIIYRSSGPNVYATPLGSKAQGGTDWLHMLSYNNTRCLEEGGGAQSLYTSVSAQDWHVQVMQLAQGDYRLWLDNVLTGPSGNTRTFTPFTDVGNLQGDFAEVVVYNRSLTDKERRQVSYYLAAKYGWTPVVGFKPTDITDCALWLKADDGVQTDGSVVTNWLDRSGNNNHAVQGDALRQPTLTNGVINGLPVVRFADTGQYLTFNSTIVAQESTVFIIFRQTGANGWYQPLDSKGQGGNSWLHMIRDNNTRCLEEGGGAQSIYTGESSGAWRVQAMQLAQGDYRLWLDTILFGTSGNMRTFTPFTDVGSFPGELAEVVVYRRTLTMSERNHVDSYLAAKYGVSTVYADRPEPSYVWVKVPAMAGTNTCIWAHWGNTTRTNLPAYATNGATWNSGYAAVWHLGDTPATSLADSTASRYAATSGNVIPSNSGKVGGCLAFDGAASSMNVASTDRLKLLGGRFTLSAWVNLNASDDGVILGKGQNGQTWYSWFLTVGNNNGVDDGNTPNRLCVGVRNAGGPDKTLVTQTSDVPLSSWVHVAGTLDGSALTLYVNGVSNNAVATGIAPYDLATQLWGGADDGRDYLNGRIDELRVEDVARSPDWISACWMNQAPVSTFTSYGTVAKVYPKGVLIIVY